MASFRTAEVHLPEKRRRWFEYAIHHVVRVSYSSRSGLMCSRRLADTGCDSNEYRNLALAVP